MTVDFSETWRPVLFFALLLGPTFLWLLFRAMRGRSGTARTTAEASSPAGEWVCETCRSVNPARARRCYKGCTPGPALAEPVVALDDRAIAVAPPPVVQPDRRHLEPVAVAVAVGVGAAAPAGAKPAGGARARPPAPAPIADGAPTTAPGRRAPARGRRSGPEGSPGVPVMDPGVAAAPPSPGVGGEVTARSGRRRARTVPATAQPAASAAQPAAALPALPEGDACPFLGLRRDAGTHFEFAEPEHRCYAAGAPAKVDVNHQHSFCLGTYQDCARFRARPDAVPVQPGRP
jgi:hypothetical protein